MNSKRGILQRKLQINIKRVFQTGMANEPTIGRWFVEILSDDTMLQNEHRPISFSDELLRNTVGKESRKNAPAIADELGIYHCQSAAPRDR